MTLARTGERNPWLPIGAAAGFVAVTHYVGIAAGAPLIFLILDTGFGFLFLIVGAVAWRRRPTSRTGPLLVLSAALWSLGSHNPAGFVPMWVIGFAFEGYYDVALALLALTFPADRLSWVGRVAMWGLGGAFVIRSIGRLLLQDPPRTYPEDFPPGSLENPFAVLENRAAFETVEVLASAAIAFVAIAVALLAVRRLVRSPSLTRSVIGPVLVGSVIAMAFASFNAAGNAWINGTGMPLVRVPEPLTGFVDWLIPAARTTVPIAFLIGTLRLRSPGGPLATMASRLEREASPADVDDALAAYIENDQLAALLRTQLAELRASRARIVAAGDAERRRIERALHDGAQQHLTGVAMRLDDARRTSESDPTEVSARLGEIAVELRDAMHELRELARGIHPAILTEAGLGPAVATLARRSTIPVDLHVSLDGRMPLPTEVTAYYVVAEALTNVARSARANRAEVTIERRTDGLFIRVEDDGIGGADPLTGSGIEGLRDRVRALNGRFLLVSPTGRGTRLEAWLPCE
ncbi:MAG: sensor histidine kinase [Chloroflexota bacterium]|nr:sensor histidine kinase [Chloroflexota bacterium]